MTNLKSLRSSNPTNGELLAEYSTHSSTQWGHRIDLAAERFADWRGTSFRDRSDIIRRLAHLIRSRSDLLSRLMTLEMGKRISEARAEVEKCAVCCDYYAEHGESLLQSEIVPTEARRSYVRFDPLGVILGIMPWNFPLWQVIRFAVPTIAAGNVVLVKHASNVTGCALALEQLFEESGFPKGTYQALLVPGEEVREILCRPEIAAVSLTGSEQAGRAVAKLAGAELKKCVLELGGSDPFIVFRDAPVEHVAQQAVAARFLNAGQSCIAAKRFIVERPVCESFLHCVTEQIRSLRIGDPLLEETDLGPLARADLRDDLERQVQESIAQGAELVVGGKRVPGAGNFFEPTVLRIPSLNNICFREETFGPVLAVIAVDSPDEAVKVANQSRFGLGASIWSADVQRAERVAERIESGMVFINARVASDVRLPFGGIKASGYGRELGLLGIREFVNAKTVYVA